MFKIPNKPKIEQKTKAPDRRHFAVIPISVLKYKLTGGLFRTLVALASYCNKGGFTFVSLSRIGQDLGISQQAVSYHMRKLEKLGIVISYKNYFPSLKGSTRRIVYNDKLSDDDVQAIANEPKEPYTNKELREMASNKTLKRINELREQEQSQKVVQSDVNINDDLTSLFESVSSESELLELERALARGESIESLKARYIKHS